MRPQTASANISAGGIPCPQSRSYRSHPALLSNRLLRRATGADRWQMPHRSSNAHRHPCREQRLIDHWGCFTDGYKMGACHVPSHGVFGKRSVARSMSIVARHHYPRGNGSADHVHRGVCGGVTATACIVVSERRRRLRGDRLYAFRALDPYPPAALRTSYATEPSKAVQVVSSSVPTVIGSQLNPRLSGPRRYRILGYSGVNNR